MDYQYLLYQQGLFNDIPVMVGNTSDEGTLFVLTFDPKKYKESIQSRFGPFAERVLKFYPDSSADLNRKYMGEIFSDSYIGWYTYAWANLQTRKGKSPVYAYCFNQIQPVSAMTVLFKSNGAYHGSDVAYVFNHLDQDPKIKYTGEDSLLAQRMISYWTNFAKTGNPNGKGLEHWPVYVMGKPTVLYLDREIHTGDFDNSNMLNLMDEYYEWKRSTLQKGF
jgi:para-nitrobenzyl esterase